MIEGGYLLLARKILDSEIMDKPNHYLKLWVWMLGKAFFKDGDKLQRGQLFASIDDMRNACGYKVGARFERPTKDQIRNCYEHFTNTHMITTAKTTRGLIITICNYDFYQDINNYENHSENSTKTTRKPATSHTIEKECIKNEKERKEKIEKIFPPQAIMLAENLAERILLNNSKHRELSNGVKEATIKRWTNDIDKMNRIDNRSWEEIKAIIEWSQSHHFWSSNILSGSALRKQYDKLFAQFKPTVTSPKTEEFRRSIDEL